MIKKTNAVNSEKKSNKALWWILGGCLALLVIGGLVLGAVAYLGYKKIKREAKESRPRIEQSQSETKQALVPVSPTPDLDNTQPKNTPENKTINEEPTPADEPSVPSDIYPPTVSEKAIGYLKKVYTKGGKNYVDIDYIQWLTGAAAERAMREDGECPKAGECVVLNDYYIRNVNPLIRTFVVAPNAEILAHDFSADYTTVNWNKSWSFARFSQYFNASANNGYWDAAPFHVEIGNNEILKITEQYIP